MIRRLSPALFGLLLSLLIVGVANGNVFDEAIDGAEVTGDLWYDYIYQFNDKTTNTDGFDLTRARIGAQTFFTEGKGVLTFDYSDEVMKLQYAYGEFYPATLEGFTAGGGLGRQPIMFGRTHELDRFQPLISQSIENNLDLVPVSIDGLVVKGGFGLWTNGVLDLVYQYHDAVNVDEESKTSSDWSAYANLQFAPGFNLSGSYLENTGNVADVAAVVLSVNKGLVIANMEVLSTGEDLDFNFGSRSEFFSAQAGISVGNSQKFQLLGRADWTEGTGAEIYWLGANWLFRDSVIVQANARINPDADTDVAELASDGVFTLRTTILFN